MSDPKINYHNSLQEFKDPFDRMMRQIRLVNHQTANQGYIGSLLAKPFKELYRTGKRIKEFDFSKLALFSTLPFIGGIAGAVSGWGHLTMAYYGIAGFVIGYIVLLPYHLWKMTQIFDPDFHIEVYKKFRKEEFQLFERSFLYQDFSFNGLYEIVNGLMFQDKESEAVKTLRQEYEVQKAKYEFEIEQLKEELISAEEDSRELYEEGQNIISELTAENDDILRANQYLTELLQIANRMLFRIHNEALDQSDLRIISGVTVYELKGDQLEKLFDVGTTGSSLQTVPIRASKYQDWACVKVALSDTKNPKFNYPNGNENRMIVSFRMIMEKGKIWIYNFHINLNTNQKAYELTNHAIIESQLVFDLVHAISLNLQRKKQVSKGGIADGNTNA